MSPRSHPSSGDVAEFVVTLRLNGEGLIRRLLTARTPTLSLRD